MAFNMVTLWLIFPWFGEFVMPKCAGILDARSIIASPLVINALQIQKKIQNKKT
jgi:hypothetical protein